MMDFRRAASMTAAWVAALGTVAALTTTPSAVAAASCAVNDGVYGAAFYGDEDALLTDESGEAGTPVVLRPPLGEPGYQEWAIDSSGDDTCTIRNVRSGHYLTPAAAAVRPHQLVLVDTRPFEWQVRISSQADRVFISAPLPDGELRLDQAPLLINPPHVDLQEPRPYGAQEWQLIWHE
ncbi:hypothetical protein ACFYOT_39915 [Saccharothrix saharensis]|uniref:hypothetical protein n=1 Tax=Saccharothrix saharensis TaxID=571190 RepID=UPI0036C34553